MKFSVSPAASNTASQQAQNPLQQTTQSGYAAQLDAKLKMQSLREQGIKKEAAAKNKPDSKGLRSPSWK